MLVNWSDCVMMKGCKAGYSIIVSLNVPKEFGRRAFSAVAYDTLIQGRLV
jgi:hypothetical protein